ncbi:MAG: response regulator [Acidobacteria bacterium]|nr:response regulator [Acidobacteriota bacterium]MCI0719191.1 response regulator [Acidobacteriota bacterium]
MSASPAPTRVMVVDDDAGYARLLVDCFSGLGFQVLYVSSGEKALSEIIVFRPEIILLDIRMPRMDGFEVCRSIRRNPEHANVIIIMLTSVGEVEDKIKGIDIGANDYVVKPFGLSELFEVVARVNRFLDTKGAYLRKMEEETFLTLRGAANTVCHEINNPLTAIVGAARVLSMKLAERTDAAELQTETVSILEAAQRIQNITHQLARAIRVVTTEPVPGIKMIDLKASAKSE